MRYWLGVTDNGWFNFLSGSGLDEVNVLAAERSFDLAAPHRRLRLESPR